MALSRKFAILFLLLPLLLPQTGQAETVDVADISGSLSLLPYMVCLPDPTSRMTLEEVLSQPDWKPLNRSNQGYRKHPFWTLVCLTNGGNTPRTMMLRNPRPGVNYLDVYLISAPHPMAQFKLGNLRPTADHPIAYRHSMLILDIHPGETLTVVTRVQTIGSIELDWILSTVTDFSRYAIISSLILGFFGGLMATLLFYNLMVWKSLRDPAYLVYGAMAFFSLLFQYTIHGVIRMFDSGIPLLWIFASGWVTSGLFMVAMALFPIFFFKTARTMPRFHWILIVAVGYSGLFTLLSFCYFYTQTPESYGIFASSAIFLVGILLVICGIQGIRLKLPGAVYYLLGQGTYMAAVVLQWSLILGPVKLSTMTEFVVVAGATVDIIFISFALSSQIKTISDERNAYQLLSLAHSRFTSMGKAIGAIIHQWKAPLARLGAQITELRIYLTHTEAASSGLAANAAGLLSKMDRNLQDMGKILDDFGQFYVSGDEKGEFSPELVVKDSLALLQEKITAVRASVVFEGEWERVRLFSYPRYFSHVILTIMDNALDIFREQNVAHAKIHLRLQTCGNAISLTIEDNGGGIRFKPVFQAFIPFVSHKKTKGSGLGLPIAKMLTEEHFGGTIAVENTSRGARFILVLPGLVRV